MTGDLPGRDLPPLDLGEAGGRTAHAAAETVDGGAGRASSSPPWLSLRGLAVLALAFAVGAVTGAAVWQARQHAAQAAEIRLTAVVTDWLGLARAESRVTPQPLDEVLLTVSLHNGGREPVTVTGLRPDGWEQAGAQPARELRLAAGAWTTDVWTVLPACGVEPADTLVVDVQGPTGPASVQVPLPRHSPALVLAQARVCGRAHGVHPLPRTSS